MTQPDSDSESIKIPIIPDVMDVNQDFIQDPLFEESFFLGLGTLSILSEESASQSVYHLWRVYTCCWAANHARNLPGDFVECGVNSGFLARAIINYISFETLTDKTFYLLDTFSGVPEDDFSEAERAAGVDVLARSYYSSNDDIYHKVEASFSCFDNVILIQGKVPDTLDQVKSEQICYLSIDMNCAAPEVAAMDHLYDKITTGGMVVFDDYGFNAYFNQKIALDQFAKSRGVQILTLPTGQGLLIKP